MASISHSTLEVFAENKYRPHPIVQKTASENFERISQTAQFTLSLSSFTKKEQLDEDYEYGDYSLCQILDTIKVEGKVQQLLELGCGCGRIFRSILQNFSTYFDGIAVDAKRPTALNEPQYVIGNAEMISEIPQLHDRRFKVIFSRATFRHFVDPLRAVIEAYEKLEKDGILLIDQVIFPGLHGYEKTLLFWLNTNGYIAYADVSIKRGVFNHFMIIKTKERLELPIFYHSERPLVFGSAYYEVQGLEKKDSDDDFGISFLMERLLIG